MLHRLGLQPSAGPGGGLDHPEEERLGLPERPGQPGCEGAQCRHTGLQVRPC